MRYDDASERLQECRDRIAELRKEMRGVQEQIEPEEVEDYALTARDGSSARLSELFGDHDHLESRAAFVVSSPDAPEPQRDFAEGRGWRFRMVSHAGTSFAQDMGYRREDRWWPGVSVFQRDGGRILRVGDTQFGPGDDFCGVWHLLDLLPKGPEGWQPRFRY